MPEAIVDASVLLRYLTDEPRNLADRVADILEAAHQQQTLTHDQRKLALPLLPDSPILPPTGRS